MQDTFKVFEIAPVTYLGVFVSEKLSHTILGVAPLLEQEERLVTMPVSPSALAITKKYIRVKGYFVRNTKSTDLYI